MSWCQSHKSDFGWWGFQTASPHQALGMWCNCNIMHWSLKKALEKKHVHVEVVEVVQGRIVSGTVLNHLVKRFRVGGCWKIQNTCFRAKKETLGRKSDLGHQGKTRKTIRKEEFSNVKPCIIFNNILSKGYRMGGCNSVTWSCSPKLAVLLNKRPWQNYNLAVNRWWERGLALQKVAVAPFLQEKYQALHQRLGLAIQGVAHFFTQFALCLNASARPLLPSRGPILPLLPHPKSRRRPWDFSTVFIGTPMLSEEVFLLAFYKPPVCNLATSAASESLPFLKGKKEKKDLLSHKSPVQILGSWSYGEGDEVSFFRDQNKVTKWSFTSRDVQTLSKGTDVGISGAISRAATQWSWSCLWIFPCN